MFTFNRAKVASAAQEIADHLKIVDHVKALQDAQKLLAESCAKVNERIAALEAKVEAMRHETALIAMKEYQSIVNSVQGDLNNRIEQLAIKVGVMEALSRPLNGHLRTDMNDSQQRPGALSKHDLPQIGK